MRSQRIIIWVMVGSGAGIALTLWLLAGFVPLPSPSDSPAEVAAQYLDDRDGIRAAAFIGLVLWSVWIPFSAVISAQLRSRERGFPLWATIQFGGGLLLTMIVLLTYLMWGAAAFRADRSAETTQVLNDIGWLLFTVPAGPLGLQIMATGIVALGDRSDRPLFPRWFGYLALWCFTLTMPGFVILFFQSGPFAWNGLISFYVPAVAVGVWATFLIVYLLRAIREQASDGDD